MLLTRERLIPAVHPSGVIEKDRRSDGSKETRGIRRQSLVLTFTTV